ncbi:hypothetical protein HJ590_04890 [Naumannella sp. ID2617S]|uniref:Outer membrane channel protein CpnT-like N-terminal domain-containing protein n=1 Tax=Enemella dayhoffiae TaxID=2016507 RepID=A0A255GUM9_9ACTN|nr:hypothetical protein [Enemella dayhoffiae]NNG18916.1 hypothetical protein [Naumannella sp. ID2617S]OYO19331.1 hypothetical protein CGZ93_13225 [Enemella dayhoffiae]
MAVMLPGEVSHLLNLLGFEWPEVNEDKMFDWGGRWVGFNGEVQGTHSDADGGARTALMENRDAGMEAFKKQFYESKDNVMEVVRDLGSASGIIGGCLFVIGGLVIALKILVVIQLVILAVQIASAIAAAIPTFGASMTLIPLFEIIAQRAIAFAINFTIEQLLA